MQGALHSMGSVEAIVFVSVFALLAAQVMAGGGQWRQPGFRRRSHQPWRGPPARPAPGPFATLIAQDRHTTDPAGQLRAVMAGSFTAKRVLSHTEGRVMAAAEAAIAEAGLPWRVMAQVALGEVLASPDDAAFRAINAKRVDLLIVSANSAPLAAIEYQGEGHWQGTAPARDAVKKEALRKAGVRYIEITPEHGPADVRREIARMATQQLFSSGPCARAI